MLKTEPSWTDIQSEKSYKMCEGLAGSGSFKGVESLIMRRKAQKDDGKDKREEKEMGLIDRGGKG